MNVTAERAGGAAPRSLTPRRAGAPPALTLDGLLLAARRRTATLVGLATLAAALVLAVALVVWANGGTFTYAIDDPYIHLTIARNLATHGTYGMVPGVYQSASSSPGWVALLAALIRVAPSTAVWLPLALNALAAGAVLVLVVRSQRLLFAIEPAPLRGVAYAVLPLAMYLPALVLTGMEHTLHALLVVALLLLLARAVRRPLTGRELAGTAVLALLAGAVRYETLFLAGGAAVALVLAPRDEGSGLLARLRRREVWAFLLPPLLVTGLLGAINVHNAQYPLPNSVLAKSGLGAGQGLAGWVPSLGTALATLTSDLMVCAVLLLAAGYLAVRRLGGAQSGLCVAWVVTALLHVLYAKFGWFDRYQGYLVVSGMLLALRVLPELRLQAVWPRALLAVAVLAAVPAFKFSLDAQIPQYAHTVYQQQYTTGRFLAAAYDGSPVLVNDIGEVGWLHRGGLVDMWALGSYDVLRAYRTGRMGKPFIAQLAERDGIQVVAVYGVLHEYVPDDFVQIARWSFTGSGRPDDSDVVFYGPTAQSAATLRQALHNFAPSLPAGVQVLWSSS